MFVITVASTFAIAFEGDKFTIKDRIWDSNRIHWSVDKITEWIFDNFEVSLELGRRYKLEHNQLR